MKLAIYETKADTREEFEEAWRKQFGSLSNLTLQCKGDKAIQLHTEMRDCFETILAIASNQVFGQKEGKLTKGEKHEQDNTEMA